MINVDNTQPEEYHNDQEPDHASYTKAVMASDEFKSDQHLVYGVPKTTKAEYDAYMANPDNFYDAEEDPNEPTPSQMNEELRRGGW
jgi:hypothetical protein